MQARICASQGAICSLPGKLEALLSKAEYGLQKGEKNKIRTLKGDLEGLIGNHLMEPSELEAPALTANCWANEVRELSYDIDDFVDELVQAEAETKTSVVQRIPRFKISQIREKRKRHQWITDEISRFRTRVKEAIQRHKNYKLEDYKRRSLDECPPPPLYGEAGLRLVGMDKSSIGKLHGWLNNDGQPERKVVSILGIGGVGKTTLAKELYRKLGGQFDSRAFVRTSRKPDMRRLLTSILSQVRRHQPSHAFEITDLIDEIKACLEDKTYFIIIDDLWASSTWDIVNRALPEGNCCSRILTTTEVDVVAQICCADNSKYIFKKEPLCEKESTELFFSKVFGYQSKCPEHLTEVSNEIIRRCGGLPLAIITTAGLLARQPASKEQWNYTRNSLSYDLITNANLEGIKHALNLVYYSLPHPLKACMLYLSLYEEGYIIWKNDLVKQWIAEGFVCADGGKDKEEVALDNFDELINRGMIQPVDINCINDVLSCTVHHVVLNFIRYKSIEENFITAIDHSQTAIRLANKVRRLSLHFGNAEDVKSPANLRLSQVRSLAFFGLFKCIPSIVEFKLLQVLILHLWADHDDMSYDLTGISEMFRLRYLHINARHLHVILPKQMQRLKYLETLKIEARLSAVPSDIADLQGLLHLHLPSEANLSHGVGHMTSLRTLGYFDLSNNSAENMMNLGGLINLQDLRLTCSTLLPDNLEKNMECLGSILEKLGKLRSLTLVPAGSSPVNTQDDASASSMSISCDGLNNVSSPPALLERLELLPRFCIFPSLPKWIGELSKLCILKIAVRELSRGDIDILRKLPALAALSLYVWIRPVERAVFHKEGFPALRYFKFTCSSPCLTFVEGTMPNVRRLKLRFNANSMGEEDPVKGFEHLSGLEEISAKIGGVGADGSDKRRAQGALEAAFRKHPSKLIVNVQSVDWIFYGDGEKSTAAQKQNYQTPDQQDVITEEESVEQHGDTSKQAEIRTFVALESSLHMQITEQVKSTVTREDEHQSLEEKSDIVEDSQLGLEFQQKGSGKRTYKQGDMTMRNSMTGGFSLDSQNPVTDIRIAAQVEEREPPEKQHRIDETKIQTESRTSALSNSFSYVLKTGAKKRWRPTNGPFLLKILRGIPFLLTQRNSPVDDFENDLEFLEREMELMTVIIDENKEDEQGTLQEKWVLQMQDLVYDIDECLYIDSRLSSRSFRRIRCLKERIKSLRKWQQAAKWSQSGDIAAATAGPSRSARTPTCYAPEAVLVGIAKPKEQLLELLSPSDGHLRVISIVGCSGLGKTALARAVYEDCIATHMFDRIAWVVASDCNSAGDLLNEIIQQLDPWAPSKTTSNVSQLIHILRDKRCFIVIDQVQRAEVLYGVEHAFHYDDRGSSSRIIVTTSIQSVAAAAADAFRSDSYMYTMRGLGDADSKKLFWTKVYGFDRDPAPALVADLESIFRKCDGLPRALVSVANYVRRHRRTGKISRFANHPEAFGEMNRALAQCYNSLPDNGHRTCLLSLGVFPQGHQIKRKSLIRRWLAEGLVAGDGARNVEVVAADRFDELIDRNILEPVLAGNNIKVKRCRVHGAMAEFIVNKAISKNFITLIRNDEFIINREGPLVRRLSVQSSTKVGCGRLVRETELSAIRSLTIVNRELFDFSSCKLLRVLDLEGCSGLNKPVLYDICELLFLKYLSLRGSDASWIPKKIRSLHYLETLDLRETQVNQLPLQVIMLPQLAHLFGQFALPQELEDRKKRSKRVEFFSEKSRLQTLSGFYMDDNSRFEPILLHMRSLRKVKIYSSVTGYSDSLLVNCLQKRITGSNSLESLSIDFNSQPIDFLGSIQAPCLLSSIKLKGQLTSLPEFILGDTLSELQLSCTGLSMEALSVLEKLRCLLYLKLSENRQGLSESNTFEVRRGGFPSLERLCFEAPWPARLQIEEGAMINLTTLHLLCPPEHEAWPGVEGIEHLRRLNEVILRDSVDANILKVWKQTELHNPFTSFLPRRDNRRFVVREAGT